MGNFYGDTYVKPKSNEIDIKPKDIHVFQIEGKKKSASHVGQDTYSIMSFYIDKIRIRYFAVYDGHGDKGKQASEYVNKHIERFIRMMKNKIPSWSTQEEVLSKFTNQFTEIQMVMSNDPENFESSGTCVIACLIIDTSLYTINLGDSRAVLGSQTNKDIYAIEMSEDHKPEVPDELERIVRCGGEVANSNEGGLENLNLNKEQITPINNVYIPFRVFKKGESFPGLAISRSIGDLTAHDVGVLEIPQVSYKLLEAYDDFVVIGSDGLYDLMSSSEIIKFIYDRMNKISKENIVKALVMEARKRWEISNNFKLHLFKERLKETHNKNKINNDEKNVSPIKGGEVLKGALPDEKNQKESFFNDYQLEIQNYEKNLMVDDISCVVAFFKK